MRLCRAGIAGPGEGCHHNAARCRASKILAQRLAPGRTRRGRFGFGAAVAHRPTPWKLAQQPTPAVFHRHQAGHSDETGRGRCPLIAAQTRHPGVGKCGSFKVHAPPTRPTYPVGGACCAKLCRRPPRCGLTGAPSPLPRPAAAAVRGRHASRTIGCDSTCFQVAALRYILPLFQRRRRCVDGTWRIRLAQLR